MPKRKVPTVADTYCSAPAYTVANLGEFRSDGHSWGWRSPDGHWLWFKSQADAETFNANYQRIEQGTL